MEVKVCNARQGQAHGSGKVAQLRKMQWRLELRTKQQWESKVTTGKILKRKSLGYELEKLESSGYFE